MVMGVGSFPIFRNTDSVSINPTVQAADAARNGSMPEAAKSCLSGDQEEAQSPLTYGL